MPGGSSVDPLRRSPSARRGPSWRRTDRLGALLLLGLFLVVVFDPSDSLSGLKRYAFFALFCWWLVVPVATRHAQPVVPAALAIFFAFGVAFPALSIYFYYLQNGDFSEYDGFQTMLGFLSLALLVPVTSMNVPTVRLFLAVLTTQAFATLGIYAVLLLLPDLLTPTILFGYEKGFLWINAKDYGGLEFLQIFFKTAPFMVLPLAFYAERYFTRADKYGLPSLVAVAVCCLALLISGTRANMAFALLIPVYFAVRGLKDAGLTHKIATLLLLLVLVGLLLGNADIIVAMLDPNEFSNAVKLGYWDDYIKIFTDVTVLLFGQGIGAVHYFESLGLELRITEVTAFELVRSFGLFLALAYFAFWTAPMILLRRVKLKQYHWLWVGYGAYLVISMSNYFILSSTGMVLLSVVYSVCLVDRKNRADDKYKNALASSTDPGLRPQSAARALG
jgi:hypothetical protein